MAVAASAPVPVRLTVYVAAVLFVLAVPRTSSAQPPRLALTSVPQLIEASEWFGLGESHFAGERFKESIAAFERAMLLGRVPDGAWQVARGYAKLGNRKQALRWLSHALAAGYSVSDASWDDAAFDTVRDDASFRALERYGVRGLKSRTRTPSSSSAALEM